MIYNVIKDVTLVQKGVIAHGCNCKGVMGAGVALAIRHTWPKAYSQYVNLCRQYDDPSELLGMAQIVQVGDHEGFDNLYVANCFTQEDCGSDGKVYADIKAITEALGNVIAFAETKNLPLYLPKIGSGLGGLNWGKDVEPILKELAKDSDIDIYVCDLK
jgi:O-acetyl-ADP-ribose deacetylase (regulator of RNase III)